jgi:2',3'-cyclic-nucleotide 2'-phosphodiesterase
MAKILFFGDVFGKVGRRGVSEALPELRKAHKPDVVVANVENLCHGKGVTMETLTYMKSLGIDVFTSGNHVFEKGERSGECFRTFKELVRPENYEGLFPGGGVYRFVKNGQWFCIINLNGQVFFENQFRGTITSPFTKFDELLRQYAKDGDIILVDLHAEATSEKVAFGWYVDGRATAVFGTHTHVPTSDAQILPHGTSHISDVGMCGPKFSVLGLKTINALERFIGPGKGKFEPEDEGPCMVRAVLVETEGAKAVSIQHIILEV